MATAGPASCRGVHLVGRDVTGLRRASASRSISPSESPPSVLLDGVALDVHLGLRTNDSGRRVAHQVQRIDDAYIVGAGQTPFGAFSGACSRFSRVGVVDGVPEAELDVLADVPSASETFIADS